MRKTSFMQNALIYFLLVLAMTGGRESFGANVSSGEADPSTGLYRYAGCVYVETKWNDGDSFLVRLPSGEEVTARLYQVDCIETSIQDTTAARRLRAQRRYFGISDYGQSPRDSIEKAVELGRAGSAFARDALKEPFTLWTSYADARGSGERVYVFISRIEKGVMSLCLQLVLGIEKGVMSLCLQLVLGISDFSVPPL